MARPHTAQAPQTETRYAGQPDDSTIASEPMSLSRRGTALAVGAVAAAMGLAACSKAAPSGTVTSTIRRVRRGAGGQRHAARRHDHLGGGARHRADLDLPGDARCQLLDHHDQHLPVRDVAAAVLVRQRGQPGRGAVHEPGRPAGVLQWRQDRDGPHEDELPVVGRPAGDRQGRPVLPRHGAGRRAGERGELGAVHPAHRHTGPGGQRQHAERHDAGAPPEQAGQPGLVHRRRAVLHPADAGARLGQGLGERPGPGLHQPGEREEDLRLPGQAVRLDRHLRDATRCGRSWTARTG